MTAGLDLVLITDHGWGQMSLSVGIEGLSRLVSAGWPQSRVHLCQVNTRQLASVPYTHLSFSRRPPVQHMKAASATPSLGGPATCGHPLSHHQPPLLLCPHILGPTPLPFGL